MNYKPQRNRGFRLLLPINQDISRNLKRFLNYHGTERIWFSLTIETKIEREDRIRKLKLKVFRNDGVAQTVLDKRYPFLVFVGYNLLVILEQLPDVVAFRWNTQYIRPGYF